MFKLNVTQAFYAYVIYETHFCKHIYRIILIHISRPGLLFVEKNAFVKLASLKHGSNLSLTL